MTKRLLVQLTLRKGGDYTTTIFDADDLSTAWLQFVRCDDIRSEQASKPEWLT